MTASQGMGLFPFGQAIRQPLHRKQTQAEAKLPDESGVAAASPGRCMPGAAADSYHVDVKLLPSGER